MKKISSRWTAFYKRAFPTIWFGFLAFFVVMSIRAGAPKQDFVFILVPVVMAAFGFLIMKRLVWDLVDEVYDCGVGLLIRNRGDETLVPLSNIMNVSVTYMNPPRITLKLITPVTFGDEIAFCPITGFRLNPFAKNPVAEDLIMRVHRARSGRAV